MRRLSLFALPVVAALALAGAVLAAGPELSVSATTSAFASTGSTIIRFQDTGTDPTASVDLYAPPGYSADLGQPLGSTLGTIDGHVSTATVTDLRVTGLIKNVDPATAVTAAATCTPDRTLHDAVWTVGLNGGGVAIGRLTLFVDHAPASQSTEYSARLRACFDDPTASGFRLLRATLTLNSVFANAGTAGEYRWTTILRTLSNPPAPPVENQTIVRLPPSLSINRKLIQPRGPRGRKFIRVSGTVSEWGRGVSGVRVEVLAGPRPSSFHRLTYVTSFERGKYVVVAPLAGNRAFKARIAAPLRDGPLSRCETFSLQPDAGCSSLTLAPFSAQSPTVTLRIK